MALQETWIGIKRHLSPGLFLGLFAFFGLLLLLLLPERFLREGNETSQQR
jgi:hypothetical protein